jgi:hypothetical protein
MIPLVDGSGWDGTLLQVLGEPEERMDQAWAAAGSKGICGILPRMGDGDAVFWECSRGEGCVALQDEMGCPGGSV